MNAFEIKRFPVDGISYPPNLRFDPRTSDKFCTLNCQSTLITVLIRYCLTVCIVDVVVRERRLASWLA